MQIEMMDVPQKGDTSFVVKTDGEKLVTKYDENTVYTYIDENKNFYKLVNVDNEYFSYKVDHLEEYELDISVILELFLLSPQDFRLDDDGYYRPIIILYTLKDLEFNVVDGYISNMSFTIELSDEEIQTSIVFNNINQAELNFPEYTQFTLLEQAEFFLKEDNHSINLNDNGFTITVEDITLAFESPNNYIVITKDESSFYYFPDYNFFKTNLTSSSILFEDDIIEYYQSSYIKLINLEYVNNYYYSFLNNYRTTLIESIEETE
jgi:hypothetical protein